MRFPYDNYIFIYNFFVIILVISLVSKLSRLHTLSVQNALWHYLFLNPDTVQLLWVLSFSLYFPSQYIWNCVSKLGNITEIK